jgi:hypothetical protein
LKVEGKKCESRDANKPHTKMSAAVSIQCDEAQPALCPAGSLTARRRLLPRGVGLFQIDLPGSIGGTGQQPGQIPPVGHQFILRLHVHLRSPCSRCLAVPDRRPREYKSPLMECESGGGPPQSKTLARRRATSERREASWSAPAPALWETTGPDVAGRGSTTEHVAGMKI